MDVKSRTYISGPTTGLPEHNFPAFAEAAHTLRQAGYETVVSPHEILPATEHKIGGVMWRSEHSWDMHMRADIAALLECDTIVLLPGWHASRGSRLELTIAMELGFAVYFYDNGKLLPMG